MTWEDEDTNETVRDSQSLGKKRWEVSIQTLGAFCNLLDQLNGTEHVAQTLERGQSSENTLLFSVEDSQLIGRGSGCQ